MVYWIPQNDSRFRDWMENFLTILPDHLAELGLVEADIATLISANTQFGSRLTGHITEQAAAKAATSAKDDARAVTELHLKSIVREINNRRAMTNELRNALGLPPRGVERELVQVAGTEIKPDLFLQTQPGVVYVHFGTTPANERTNGKPEGVKGCNIYRKKVGDAEYTMVAYATSSPYVDNVPGPAADYVYVARYRGAKITDLGPQSAPLTVAAGGELAA